MLDAQLPNDLLHNPPWPETVASASIDDALLFLNADAEQEVKAAGYYLKYGIEVNLAIFTPEEARKIAQTDRWNLAGEMRQPCLDQFLRDAAAVPERSFMAAAQETNDLLEAMLDEGLFCMPEERAQWMSGRDMTRAFYEQATGQTPCADIPLAQKNFMIAALHLLAPSRGGVRGLIEQRFSSQHYGRGWWDGRHMVELRTIPVRWHEEAICNYHEVLWRLKRAVESFGFVPVVHTAHAQPHFSLWRASDDTNIMDCDDESSLLLRGGIARNLFMLLREQPLDRPLHAFKMQQRNFSGPFAGASRASCVRTCNDGSWELRLTQESGVTHMARALFFISHAAGISLMEKDRLSFAVLNHDCGYTDGAEGNYVRLTKYYMTHGGLDVPDVRKIRRLTLAPAPGRSACPFMSCLEGAVIGDDGALDVPEAVLEWNLPQLGKAVGRYGKDLYSAQISGQIRNLETVEGWRALFRKIRVSDGNSLDCSQIPHSLQRHFHGLEIRRVRPDIFMGPENPRNEVILKYAHRTSLAFHVGNFARAHPEIVGTPGYALHQFAYNRELVCDPDEASRVLALICNSGLERLRRDRKLVMHECARDSVYYFMQRPIEEYLAHAMRYRATYMQEAFCYEDHALLSLTRSWREALCGAAPGMAARSNEQTRAYLGRFMRHLDNPRNLYGFESMKMIVMGLTTKIGYLLSFDIPNLLRMICEDEGKTIEDVLDGACGDKAFARFRDSLEWRSVCAGGTMASLAAAMQDSESDTIDVLREFNASAAGKLVELLDEPVRDRRSQPTLDLVAAMVTGLAAGMRERTAELLADQTPLTELRGKASAMIAEAHRQMDHPRAPARQ